MKPATIPIAFQGIHGAYSHEALLEFGKQKGFATDPVESLNFEELFKNIHTLGLGFVPIENSNAGTVIQVVDLFLENDIEIIGEYYFKVNHFLLAKKNTHLEDIQKVYSHPQALTQCSKFINTHKLIPVPFADTAGSAKHIHDHGEKGDAVIGSENLAVMYNLKVIRKNVQNSNNNVTRFFLVKKRGKSFHFEKTMRQSKNGKKTSLIFSTRDIPGALYKALGGFATNGVNLTKIESRPSKEKNFTYFFYIDFEESPTDQAVKNSLDELHYFSKMVKILGTYPVENS